MIVLASNSPRRRELLTMMNIPHIVFVSSVDETKYKSADLRKLPSILSLAKARDVAQKHPTATIIGADTIVLLDGEILEKPVDDADCYRILSRLSDRQHEVITAVTIINQGHEITFSSTSKVTFYPLDDGEIKRYILSKEPFDKAGAYAIQGLGAKFIRSIEGDFYTIMGLPIAELYWHLKKMNII